MASVKLQSGGRGCRSVRRVDRREKVARNCSGRSVVGGGLKRVVVVVVVGGGSMGGSMGGLVVGWSMGSSGVGFGGLVVVVVVGAKRVRVSERGMRGKEAVEKT